VTECAKQLCLQPIDRIAAHIRSRPSPPAIATHSTAKPWRDSRHRNVRLVTARESTRSEASGSSNFKVSER
jgi:hypothetical protein